MYKVFVNENVILLTSQIPFGSKINLYDLKKISLDDILSNVKKHKKIFLFHKSSEKLISSFKKKIKVISAGGGVVKNSFDETEIYQKKNELKSQGIRSLVPILKKLITDDKSIKNKDIEVELLSDLAKEIGAEQLIDWKDEDKTKYKNTSTKM